MIKLILKLFPVIVLAVICGFGICVLVKWREWRNHCEDATIKLSFSQFVNMYNVAPDKYELSEDETIYGNAHKTFMICFSFEDYLKYRQWLKRLKSDCLEAESIEARKEYIECVRRDVDAFKEDLEDGIQSMRELHL